MPKKERTPEEQKEYMKIARKKSKDKKYNFKYKESQILPLIEKTRVATFLTKCQEYIDDCHKNHRVPLNNGFWKAKFNIWITFVLGDKHTTFSKYPTSKAKLQMVKDIISEANLNFVVERNISKSSFALYYLQQEHGWDKEIVNTAPPIIIQNFKELPPAGTQELIQDANIPVVITEDADILEAEVIDIIDPPEISQDTSDTLEDYLEILDFAEKENDEGNNE